MSEATLRKLLAETEAEIPNLKTEEEAWAHLLRFYERTGKDVAEFACLNASGLTSAGRASVHDCMLMSLIENVATTQIEFGLSSKKLLDAAVKSVGDAFHGRFMELDAFSEGGRS